MSFILNEVFDVNALESDSSVLADKIIACKVSMATLVQENARRAMDQDD